MQILLVEDDILLGEGIVTALKREGFAVNHVTDGETALRAVKNEMPDILILDLGLPDIDGLEVLKRIRREKFSNPVLVLTARDSLDDKICGLDSGADDYMAKPFELKELLARLRALERRIGSIKEKDIVVGPISLDTAAHTVTMAGEQIPMPRREYMVLKAMMENVGRIQTRENLESKLYSWGEEVGSNTIEVHIHNLRKKLTPKFIQTVRGVGYVIRNP